ncbi:VanW family protein [Candidatus Saganbacteria bacterium]|nr:VanW family protein [Candidatus Saganbacteria bacterium]
MILFDFFTTQNKFSPRTLIEKVDVSGLTAEEAVIKLNQSPVSDLLPGTVAFVNSGESFSFSPRDLGIFVKATETVSQAFSLSHGGNYLKTLSQKLSGKYRVYPAKFSFVPETAQEIILEIAQQLDAPPVDAKITIDESTGGYHIYPEKFGRKLRISNTLENLKQALDSGKPIIALDIEITTKPKITETMLREHPPVFRLSAFTTYYGTHDSKNRIHNIKLIASWLNNTIILPDEVMSLSENIGDFTAERGFKEAFVIMNGELVPQLGGGTCQIGTTLYNAVQLADLEIISRRNHSFYFNIYPLGRDATVYPGSADFKFKNNTGRPVLIKAVANNRKLSFRIFGTSTGKKVEFSNPSIYLLGEDGSFHPSNLRSAIASDAPFRTVVVRTVYNASGEAIKKETIRSYYKLYGEKSNVPIKRPEPR